VTFPSQFIIWIRFGISQNEESNPDQSIKVLDCLGMCQSSVMTNAGLTSPSAKKRLGRIDYLEDVLDNVMMIALRH
jgi:hypothetical protein